MNAVKEDVEKLVQKELESANQRFPMFRSDHEGVAVVFEEIEEAKTELEEIDDNFHNLWCLVKDNDIRSSTYAGWIFKSSIRLACEAIQVAAMAQKFIDSQKMRNGDVRMTNAEYIRNMTEEELVEFLMDFEVCEYCDYSSSDECLNEMCEDVGRKCLLKWLKQPV